MHSLCLGKEDNTTEAYTMAGEKDTKRTSLQS